MMFSKSRLNSHDVFRNSVEKPHNTYTTQLVSSIAFQSSYFVGSSEQNNGKEFNDLLVWPSILCLIRYYFVSSKSCSFFGEIWAWHVCILTEKRQNANINHTGKKNGRSTTVVIAQTFHLLIFWCTVKKNGF